MHGLHRLMHCLFVCMSEVNSFIMDDLGRPAMCDLLYGMIVLLLFHHMCRKCCLSPGCRLLSHGSSSMGV